MLSPGARQGDAAQWTTAPVQGLHRRRSRCRHQRWCGPARQTHRSCAGRQASSSQKQCWHGQGLLLPSAPLCGVEEAVAERSPVLPIWTRRVGDEWKAAGRSMLTSASNELWPGGLAAAEVGFPTRLERPSCRSHQSNHLVVVGATLGADRPSEQQSEQMACCRAEEA
jgi:hypothetical protein